MDPTSKNAHIVGLTVGSIMTVAAPMFGLIATIFSVRRAFAASTITTSPNPAHDLAEGISTSMNHIVLGMVFSALGFLVAVVLGARLFREEA